MVGQADADKVLAVGGHFGRDALDAGRQTKDVDGGAVESAGCYFGDGVGLALIAYGGGYCDFAGVGGREHGGGQLVGQEAVADAVDVGLDTFGASDGADGGEVLPYVGLLICFQALSRDIQAAGRIDGRGEGIERLAGDAGLEELGRGEGVNSDGVELRTAVEDHQVQLLHARTDVDALQRGAVLECLVVDEINAVGDDDALKAGAEEEAAGHYLEACWQGGLDKGGTAVEDVQAQRVDAARQCHRGQAGAVAEGADTDALHTLVDGQGLIRHKRRHIDGVHHARAAALLARALRVECQLLGRRSIKMHAARRADELLPGRDEQRRGQIMAIRAAVAGKAGIHQAQTVQKLRSRAERAADARHAGALVQSQCGRYIQHLVHAGPRCLRHAAAGIGGQGLEIAARAFGIQHAQRQRRLAGPGHACDPDDFSKWNIDVNIFQVVDLCSTDQHLIDHVFHSGFFSYTAAGIARPLHPFRPRSGGKVRVLIKADRLRVDRQLPDAVMPQGTASLAAGSQPGDLPATAFFRLPVSSFFS